MFSKVLPSVSPPVPCIPSVGSSMATDSAAFLRLHSVPASATSASLLPVLGVPAAPLLGGCFPQ